MAEVFEFLRDNLNIIVTIIAAIIAIVSVAFKVKSNFTAAITKLIADAEQYNLSGPEKMELVINWLKDIIPRIFSVVFNDKTLTQISQNIYDDVKRYRDEYIKNRLNIDVDTTDDGTDSKGVEE